MKLKNFTSRCEYKNLPKIYTLSQICHITRVMQLSDQVTRIPVVDDHWSKQSPRLQYHAY